MVPSYEKWMELLAVSRGDIKADKCLRNGRIINPITGEICEADLAIHRGVVVGTGNYDAHENIDIDGDYVSPGFIEGHIHIESSMLDPKRFCEAIARWGTTTVVADPHEIANVMGHDGLEYFIQCAERITFVDLYFVLPSCVPASSFETTGSQLSGVDLFRYLGHPKIIGLGEVMNFPGVVSGMRDVWDKLLLFQDQLIDGHAPLLTGRKLNAYILSGIRSDHECTSPEEAREKLSKGMTIMIREGSQTKDLSRIIEVVDDKTWHRCMFVSDDRHPDDLLQEGHLNVQINKAVDAGMDPVMAISLVTWTPALYFGFRDRGALFPGAIADFSISSQLTPWETKCVFKRGVEIYKDGQLLVDAKEIPPAPPSPMAIKTISEDDIKIPAKSKQIRVIGLIKNSILTENLVLNAKIDDNFVVSDVERDILKIVVWNRYLENAKPTVGFCKGFGFQKGAIASTIAHDNHNLIAVGTDDRSIVEAARVLVKCGGGISVCIDGTNVDYLPLPIAGLMSDKPLEEVAEAVNRLKEKSRAIGSIPENPFMVLSFLALAVVPSLKITDRGLVDVNSFSFTGLFVEDEK